MDLPLALLIPDTHRPYHDKRAVNLMLMVAHHLSAQLSEIVIMGDYADFYSISSHQKDPRVIGMLKDEIIDVNKGLDQLDQLFPDVPKYFVEGNHEYRLERFLINQAASLFGITSVEHLLNLNRRPLWHFIPYGPAQMHKVLGSKLFVRHEPLGTSAKATASKALCSLAYGHIHRIEESHLVGLEGDNHVCFSVGWLGDKGQDKIFNYVKGHHQWQLGFGLVWVDRLTKKFYHHKIHILDNYTCVVDGKKFSA
jgi:hypothetical protein